MKNATKQNHLSVALFAICFVSVVSTCNCKKEILTTTDPCQNYPAYFPDFIISEMKLIPLELIPS